VARLSGARAAIDISDGLVADIRHLARASGVGIDLSEVPVAPVPPGTRRVGAARTTSCLLATADPADLRDEFAGPGCAHRSSSDAAPMTRAGSNWLGRPVAGRRMAPPGGDSGLGPRVALSKSTETAVHSWVGEHWGRALI